MSEFLLGVVASLLAAVMFPAVAVFGRFLLASAFGWLPIGRKINLNGAWRSTWHVSSPRFPPFVTDSKTRVRQFGSNFFANFEAQGVDMVASGIVDSGRYVTGTWKDRIEGGYHGSFQLIIDPFDKKKMSGTWIGFSSTGVVKNGAWEWEKV
jgi:hypothetical protein